MIITIARQCGCQGDSIGNAIGEALSIPVYNKKAITELAKEKGIQKEYPSFFEEREVNVFLSAIANDEDNDFMHQIPKRILHTLFDGKDGVIIGRCGNFALEKEADLRIFLSDSEQNRVNHIMESHAISKRKAERLVEEVDERRSAYHKYYTGQTWGMAKHYDLCVDMSIISVEMLIKLIQTVLKC